MHVFRATKQAKQAKQVPRPMRRGLPHLQPSQGWLVASSLINALGSGLFYPFAVLYFHAVADLSLPLVGLGLTVTTGVSLATVPLQGALVDRLGAHDGDRSPPAAGGRPGGVPVRARLPGLPPPRRTRRDWQ
jgi:hypothetical protein